MSNNPQGNQNYNQGNNQNYNEQNNQNYNQQGNQNGGHSVFNTNTTVLNTTDTQTETETARSMETKMDVQTISIIAGVGILVVVIIIAQTIALCYFKRKAKPRRRMDTLTSRTRFDRGDTARYSAPPSRKGTARAQADTDSHIYEMVGVNALYKESKELNQTVKTDANGRTLKNRPRLPLPSEAPDVPQHTLTRPKPSPLNSAVSTLSLISNSSTLTKKGKEPPPGQPRKPPARPPKQIEEDLPGSLKRPPKALPTSVAPKTGSIPKMPATDPAMLELKNMFKNRNIGNDSPASSPITTLEKKPKIQAKPFQKPKPEEPPIPPKSIGINPLAQGPSQIRLILPKIEATLKKPNLQPVTLKKPMTTQQAQLQTNPSPVSQLTSTHPTPIPSRPTPPIPNLTQPSTSHVPPLQSRPLPPIEASRPLQIPNEASTRRQPPPTPDAIYQTAEEGESPQTDDDEEWTYEQLEQYNLYNI